MRPSSLSVLAPQPTRALPRAGLGLAVLSLAVLAACGPSGGGAPGGAGGMQMPPPPVGVLTVQTGSVALTTELPGRLEAVRTAQVRARVTGVVQKRLFTEGAVVKAGQSLYVIDPAPYKAALDSALASQAKAEANLAQAQATLERNRPLAESKAISQADWVSTQAAHKAAEADVAAAKAAVQTARLNVDYAAVQAPIGGRIGRSVVTEGALVSQGEATLLATIQQTDPMVINFTQSAAEVMKLRRAIEAGKLQGSGSTQVRVVLEDGSEYPLPGKLQFADISVDATSGQVTLRAEVPNPKGELLPGLFVKVRLEQVRSDNAILLPQQAVTRGTTGDTVLVVGEDKQVAPRPVQLGGAKGTQWVVLGGLKAGEQVVVDGFQKIRPKAPVSPVPWTPGAAPAAGDAPGAASGAASGAAAPAAPASGASR
ncbi:efflux RND transporter periplasmic adaptor subunit [Ideonella livida]|nr:efflux RND transporter periplasmic adaptor subunit [Ideonella livida]